MCFGLQFGPRQSTSTGLSVVTGISRWIVRCHVSFGRPTLLRHAGFQRRACFDILWSDIIKTCPYHLQRFIFSFSITLPYPDLLLSSSSLTITNHLISMIVFRHPLPNLLTFYPKLSQPPQLLAAVYQH